MTVESATFINDLQPVNPPSTDPVQQGDDHLRLIKQVLQNTFAGASRQWQIPGASALSTSSSIVKANGESILYVSTAGGAVTLTLPTLVSGDAGWRVWFVKTSSDANPIFVAPPTGTINSGGVSGLSKARRCIPGVQFAAVWDGTNWFVTRVTSLPIGSCIEYHGTSLPAGYEWPNGQTLSSAANYPEYNAVMGALTTRDKRGYISVTVDNLGGSAAGHLPTTFIASTTFGAVGGSDHTTLAIANLPAFTPAGGVSLSLSGFVVLSTTANQVGTLSPFTDVTIGGGGTSNLSVNFSGSSASFTGSSTSLLGMNATAFSILQPSIMVNQILVVE